MFNFVVKVKTQERDENPIGNIVSIFGDPKTHVCEFRTELIRYFFKKNPNKHLVIMNSMCARMHSWSNNSVKWNSVQLRMIYLVVTYFLWTVYIKNLTAHKVYHLGDLYCAHNSIFKAELNWTGQFNQVYRFRTPVWSVQHQHVLPLLAIKLDLYGYH